MSRWKFAGLFLVAGALIAATYFRGTGLEEAQPIDAFLDGNLPATLAGDIIASSTSDNANTALAMQAEIGGDRMFVVEQSGRIYTFLPTDVGLGNKSLFMDISGQVLSGQDSGVLGFALHPSYNAAGSPSASFFYVYYTTEREGQDYLRLSRFSGTASGDVNSELVMFEQMLGDMMHRGGGMVFGDDGFLYLAIGDLGWMEQSQNITDRLSGGVLRIDVDQQGGAVSHPPRRTLADVGQGFSGIGYYIPSNNPFLNEDGDVFEEYYALGSRNPHRMTKDRATGIMYIGNVGSNSGDKREEVNVLARGANFGWPFREGTLDRPDLMLRPDEILGSLTDPIHEYQHTSGDGCSVIGGYVYRGSALPAIAGKYILTDFCSKKIWALDVNAGPGAQKEELLAIEFNPVTFGEDATGELYIGVQGWHPVFKLIASGNNEEQNLPALLSQTGAFDDLVDLTPSPGVIPYDIIAPLWSDGAEKQRWMAIPNNGSHDTSAERISYDETDDWAFPIGSVLIKHFEIALDESMPDQTRRLETRFLVHGEDGQYYAFTYKWNDAGTDATLLEAGVVEALSITDEFGEVRSQDWYYPSRSDCFVCHTSAAGRVLGPKARQLNSDLYYPQTGLTGNQIESLNHIGSLDPAADIDGLANLLTSSHLADATSSIEERARSYLDANCAGCHQPEGGPRSEFDLRMIIDLSESGLINGEVIEDLGIEGARVIVPGEPQKSVLYQRISEIGTATAMPPLAKNRLDEAAVSLIHDWIVALGALPVEMVAFEALQTAAGIQLRWETASETNNAGFAVERQVQHPSGVQNVLGTESWEEIGFVEGNGTTLDPSQYQFLDGNLPAEIEAVHYRLKQIDFDGTFSYSDQVITTLPLPEAPILYSNYPNPFNPITTIAYALPVDADVLLVIYDLQGRLVRTLVDHPQRAGHHSIPFDARDLASGTYLYRLTVGSTTVSKRMVLIK